MDARLVANDATGRTTARLVKVRHGEEVTQLNARPLVRETALHVRARGKFRALVVEAHAGYVVVRPKGCRHGYAVNWIAVFHLGAKMAAEAARRERKARAKRT